MAFIKKELLFSLFVFFSMACNDAFIPKHAGYPKIELPQKTYTTFNHPHFSYTFDYPTYSVCVQDSNYMPQEKNNHQWLNIQLESLNATIYLTYKNFVKENLEKLIYDSYKFTNKQVYKATSIEDSLINSPQGYKMIFYTVRGNAATTHQFFATDAKKHFLRGSLYLNSSPNEDSLKIITDFIKPDIIKLMQSLRFKN